MTRNIKLCEKDQNFNKKLPELCREDSLQVPFREKFKGTWPSPEKILNPNLKCVCGFGTMNCWKLQNKIEEEWVEGTQTEEQIRLGVCIF